MKSQWLKKRNMPDEPGIYIFKDSKNRPLYIGRATSLKNRVRSYFSNDLIETRGHRIADMVVKAKSIGWKQTDSILEAVILESRLIKKYQPRYNVEERDDKSSNYVVVTDEAWPRVFLARARDFEQGTKDGTLPYAVKKNFGPFAYSGIIIEAMKILRRMFPFRDKKAHDFRHESFYTAIGKSPEGVDEIARKKYLRTIDDLVTFFEGGKKKLRGSLNKQMEEYAASMEFEEADRIKKLLYAVDHINDTALLKRQDKVLGKFRIEAYDIAHLSGMKTVGAMAVSIDSGPAKSEYRRFKISRDSNDDLANLAELLNRRLNHPEWPYPDLMVVDGNEMHVKVAEHALKSRHISIPITAVVKDAKHRASRIIGDKEIVGKFRDLIIATNAEAHRFALKYHRNLRG
ncbi:GIY-YIG nuclease family protein [Patescibacteria group bacterium]|nr:GIY-YIG nuclease family protein [Patescibacteria group bacterium]